ncbi:MAG: MBL fold metallo-hydrolase [Ktedonobacterales bacterium]
MRLVLLGTAGGPRPNAYRSSPAQVLLIDGQAHVVDCGYGVARQLVLAGVPLDTLRRVFITHHHSDHNADYGNLMLLAWASGLHTVVDTYGPPPIARMRNQFLELNAYDISTRTADEARDPFPPLFLAHEVSQAGVVLEEGQLKVTAAVVRHPPVTPSLAYRFETAQRSIVISGDTAYCSELIELARGADVLVHEALYMPAVEALVGRVRNARQLLAHISSSHTTAEEAGKVAQAAGVSTLVLSHLVPADDPELTDELWLRAASTHFTGEVIVGRDLLTI